MLDKQQKIQIIDCEGKVERLSGIWETPDDQMEIRMMTMKERMVVISERMDLMSERMALIREMKVIREEMKVMTEKWNVLREDIKVFEERVNAIEEKKKKWWRWLGVPPALYILYHFFCFDD